MAKVKTTLSIDEHLMRRVRVKAARTGRRQSEILETALHEGLSAIERIRERADLSEEEALDLVGELVHEIRRERQARSTNPA